MAPDLSYLLYYLIGTSPDNGFSVIKTFGLMLALAIFVAAVMLNSELKRKEREGLLHPVVEKQTVGAGPSWGSTAVNALIGFVIGAKLLYVFQYFSEFQADTAGVLLSTKGDVFGGVLGAILFGGMHYWNGKKKELPNPVEQEVKIWPHDRIGDITVLAAVSGVAGAKLFDILEHLDQLVEDPIGTIFSGGGLAIYGGLIVAFIVVALYLRSKKIALLPVMDAVAPALIVAYGIGRLGCHLSGDGDWGIVRAAPAPDWWFLPDWVWSYNYPHNVIREGIPIEGCTFDYCMVLAENVYPTSVYEIIMALTIGAILWSLRKRIKIPGMLFALYMIFNGIERFSIESIRVNERYNFLGMHPTQAEIIAVVMILGGIALGAWLYSRRDKA